MRAEEGGPAVTSDGPAVDPFVAADAMFARMSLLPSGCPERAALRSDVILSCRGSAHRLATRYRTRADTAEDLRQVAVMGLILAVDRFQVERGVPFRHFAVPTIEGELKRFFRATVWDVHVARRTQETYLELRSAECHLAQLLGHFPGSADLARHLRLPLAEIAAAQAGGAARCSLSLNRPAGAGLECDLVDLVGAPDPDLERLPVRDALARGLDALPERLVTVIRLRFVEELTQAEVGRSIGVSQMQACRLIDQAVTLLRHHVLADVTASHPSGPVSPVDRCCE
jgi:RNA polymerase sigma-B factor